MHRTHKCSELNINDINKTVTLCGWVHSKRDHGSLIFIDLRDHYGITQIVIDQQDVNIDIEQISSVKLESVIKITGKVVKRDEIAINKNISTGEIEVKIEKFSIESESLQIPFQVNTANENYPEELRLKYRFLDLRRERVHNNIILRSKVISKIRKEMENLGFLEINTPILTSSSPEGARDYVVPSRIHPGRFYALPQAPQQFKQLLMISGFDRYFQIAPCFRDEDLRSDRTPEFYQLDMELAFATQQDVFDVVEPLMKNIFKEFGTKKTLDENFIQIPYNESLLKYGTDKPDLRNPIEINDASELFKNSDFSIFAKAIEKGDVVRAIPAKNTHDKPRSFFDKMIEYAIENGAKGLAYIIFDENGIAKGPIAKLLDNERIENIKKSSNLSAGDSVFFACGSEKEASKIAGIVRTKIANELDLIDNSIYKFCWIIDFPMYEFDEATNKIDFSHNPFSMPQGGIEALNSNNPLEIKAYQYDIVCNGVELSSGAIRNHKPEIMYKAFEVAGYNKDAVDSQFGAMINAFKYGAPPHGGIAPGIERILMLLADEPNIREMIAFPMNGKAQDLLMNSPNTISEKHLKELNIELGKKARDHLQNK